MQTKVKSKQYDFDIRGFKTQKQYKTIMQFFRGLEGFNKVQRQTRRTAY